MKNLDSNLRTIAIAAATSFIVATIAAFTLFAYLWNRASEPGEQINFPSIVRKGAEESSVVEVVKSANPAVVSVTVSKDVPVVERFFQPGSLDDLFGFSIPLPLYRQNGTEQREVGGGSGFLVSSDGYIVTNRHVVDDPKAEYTVFTNDGQKHSAKVAAIDPLSDVAVLKIDGGDYPFLKFGDSDGLEVGQTAIAIGNALGEFRNTVSVGVISGLSRSIVASDPSGRQAEALDEVIQTDAAINRGNSGGPLLDLSGQVVGINVAVAAGSENIGFALPVNGVKNSIESVLKGGKITRPFIGIRYVPVTSALKTRNNLPYDYGVLVLRGEAPEDLAVIPGSPADKAGIVENDIILEADNTKLTEERRLSSVIRNKKVGEALSLKVWHRGQTKNVRIVLETMPVNN